MCKKQGGLVTYCLFGVFPLSLGKGLERESFGASVTCILIDWLRRTVFASIISDTLPSHDKREYVALCAAGLHCP